MIAGGWGRDRIGWLGMNWDETGGAEGPGIAEIARKRRDRKGSLTTDQH